QANRAARAEFEISNLKFTAWVYVFKSPRSYTAEDLVEFHIPGNIVLARLLVDEIVRQGARRADAGEFTARAYFNGRMDLTEAEGVAAAISAQNEGELRAARQLVAGALSKRIQPALDLLAETLALLEVGIDFSDEDVTFISASDARERIRQVDVQLQKITSESARFEELSSEPVVVLVGRPNAGKSTLLNRLSKMQRAV